VALSKSDLADLIDGTESELRGMAEEVWADPELGLQEEHASRVLMEALTERGFTIEEGIGGMPTAFVATYGDGDPTIGILGEYDALPNLSQKIAAERDPVEDGGNGHGCGHNLFGVGSLGAAIAVRDAIERGELDGTIRYYGCPAEEILVGKTYMAREGVFDDLDACLAWHPGQLSTPLLRRWQAMDSIKYEFAGVSAHAAAAPDSGRSALDGVQLLNTGVEYLREHVPDEVSVHYSIREGGDAPNVVPAEASVWYFVRGESRDQVDRVTAWLDDIAEGAATMTRTDVEGRYLTGCHSTLHNEAISELIAENLEAFSLEYTAEQRAFAAELRDTFDEEDVRTRLREEGIPEERLPEITDHDLYADPLGIVDRGESMKGSTEVGDVSWIVPTAEFYAAAWPVGTPAHTWQAVAANGSFGQEAMLYAAKVLAGTAVDLLTDPDALARARSEFRAETDGQPYETPLPPDAEPPFELTR